MCLNQGLLRDICLNQNRTRLFELRKPSIYGYTVYKTVQAHVFWGCLFFFGIYTSLKGKRKYCNSFVGLKRIKLIKAFFASYLI